MEDISTFGKGAIQTPPEILATRYRLAAEAARVIDWSKPYNVESGFTLPQKDQKASFTCTAEATIYYCRALNIIEHGKDEEGSERFNYSQSFVPPDGGAYIWKAMSIPLKIGISSMASVPNLDHSETIMRDGSMNGYAKIEAITDKYAQLPNNRDINYLAGIIEDYHGFVTGFNGNNIMFDSKGVASIPQTVDWGHAVYVCGYCTLPDGRKALKFKNSWTAQWGDNGYGYFPEEFVKNGPLFDAFVYADIQDIDPTSMKLVLARDPKLGGKVFALVESPKKQKIWIPNPGTLTTGQSAGFWGGFPDVVEKDLSEYADGVIQISLSE
jgi:hypothetical protein